MRACLEIRETQRLEGYATCLRGKPLIRLLVRLGYRVSEALVLTIEGLAILASTPLPNTGRYMVRG
jgi:hypothetical protein